MEPYDCPNTSFSTGRKLEVLVADDEPEIREVLEFGLQQEGFSVRLAADGQKALDVYRGHSETIDVVLLDVRMPCLDGPAALVAMQVLRPQIRCCFMSGYLGHYTEKRLRRFGALAVIKKPFQVRDVAQTLRTAAEHEALNASRAVDGAHGRVLT